MARPGPKPEPARLKVLRGNPGKHRLDKNEPKPRPVAPKCPSWLPKQAKLVWRRLGPELERLGLLTELDGAAFAALCLSWARVQECQAILKAEGLTIAGTNGVLKKHPVVTILGQHLTQLRQWMAEFGLTPGSRSGINLPAPDDGDEFERYLSRKQQKED